MEKSESSFTIIGKTANDITVFFDTTKSHAITHFQKIPI